MVVGVGENGEIGIVGKKEKWEVKWRGNAHDGEGRGVDGGEGMVVSGGRDGRVKIWKVWE